MHLHPNTQKSRDNMKKEVEKRLEEVARLRFRELLEGRSIPEGDAARLIKTVMVQDRTLVAKISILPEVQDYALDRPPVDNHEDTMPLCILNVNQDTENVIVTIVNEMPWLLRSTIA